MPRELVKDTIAGVDMEAQPLPFAQAQELLPEILQVVSMLLSNLDLATLDPKSFTLKDLPKMSEALLAVGKHLADGKLARLAPKVLACTVAIADGERYELLSDKRRAVFFDAHPEAYLPSLLFAGRVTFGGFFRGAGPLAGATRSA